MVKYSDQMDIEALCCLTNSNLDFIGKTREFIIHVNKLTKIDKEKLEKMFSYYRVLKGFSEASTVTFIRIQNTITTRLLDGFLSFKNYKVLELEDLIQCLSNRLHTIMKMLYQSYSIKLWGYIWVKFTSFYAQLVISTSQSYKPNELTDLHEKIVKDIGIISECFDSSKNDRKYEDGMKNLRAISGLYSGQITGFMGHLGYLKVQFGDDFNEQVITLILRMRNDFTKEMKNKVYQ